MSGKGPDAFTAVPIPEFEGFVPACREQLPTVGRESAGGDPI